MCVRVHISVRVCATDDKRYEKFIRQKRQKSRELARGRNDKRGQLDFAIRSAIDFTRSCAIVCRTARAQCNDLMHIYHVLIVPIEKKKEKRKEMREKKQGKKHEEEERRERERERSVGEKL